MLRDLGGGTIHHRLASVASLFEHLCDSNAITHKPVEGVERLKTETGEGKTPPIGDRQARELLVAPQRTPSKASVTVRSFPCCYSTLCTGRSCAN